MAKWALLLPLLLGCYASHVAGGATDGSTNTRDAGSQDASRDSSMLTDSRPADSGDASDSSALDSGTGADCIDVSDPSSFDDPAISVTTGWHTCFATTSGRIYCQGKNLNGQTGQPSLELRTGLGPVAGVPPARRVISGHEHTCAITRAGELYCWGDNRFGQLGVPSVEQATHVPVKVPLPDSVVEADAAGDHTCATLRDGRLLCWGSNDYGELGQGPPSNSARVPTQVPLVDVQSVSLGWHTTCAVTSAGEGFCWGLYQVVPDLLHPRLIFRFDPSILPVPLTSRSFSMLETGVDVRCGLERAPARRMLCWGSADGPLGRRVLSPEADPSGTADRRFVYEPVPMAVSRLQSVVHVDVADGRACAVQRNGRVRCWAGSAVGNPKRGICYARRVVLGGTGPHICTLSTEGVITCWGDNTTGAIDPDGPGVELNNPSRVWPP
ncbi:MAG: hypothetical protein GXP55_16290 [Deltaproteobacteria bacterium]|nr:hypothetical protein [Deltaproteobacteria bacterium]